MTEFKDGWWLFWDLMFDHWFKWFGLWCGVGVLQVFGSAIVSVIKWLWRSWLDPATRKQYPVLLKRPFRPTQTPRPSR